MRTSFRTLAAEVEHEIDKIKGSRFLAVARPIQAEEGAVELESELRTRFHDARHHCLAWRLGVAGERFRHDDDGEPSGSAGAPMLREIDALELTGVAVVVVRWFGGTKLGVGGLARAYGGATREVLARAEVVTVTLTERIEVAHPYECSSALQALFAAQGIQPVESSYGEDVRLALEVPVDRVEAFLEELRERTAGRARVSDRGR